MFTCNFGYKVKRNTGGVCQGLVHMVLNIFDISPEFIGGNYFIMMVQSYNIGSTFCKIDFVIFFSKIKPNRKGFLSRKISGNIAGIHAAGKETANLNVTDFMSIHRIRKYFFNFVNSLCFGHVILRFEHGFPIASSGYFSVFVP